MKCSVLACCTVACLFACVSIVVLWYLLWNFYPLNGLLLADYTAQENKAVEHGLTLFRGLTPSQNVFSLDNSFDLLDRGRNGQPMFAHEDLLDINAETLFGMDPKSPHNANLLLPKKEVEPHMEQEATVLGRMARQMTTNGRLDKAKKLYERALLLNPERPDLLAEYGDFVERHQRDITLADHLFTKALAIDSNLERALQAHERLGPLVAEIDQKMFSALDDKRDLLIQMASGETDGSTDPAVLNAKHENYFLHVFHTVAIEGNTMSQKEMRYILETGRAIGGKSVFEHQEVLGLDAALQFISTSLLRRRGAIELDDIMDIHYRVMAYADPFNAGRLRNNQVYIQGYTPPPADRLQQLLSEFVQWLNSPAALRLHPVELAAIAHYKLVIIHPFKDGNGRTSRLLLNLILLHSGYPPVVVRLDERLEYYKALKLANAGDIRPFIRLIANCTDSTMSWFMDTISRIKRMRQQEAQGKTLPANDIEVSQEIPDYEDDEENTIKEGQRTSFIEPIRPGSNSPSTILLSEPSVPGSCNSQEVPWQPEMESSPEYIPSCSADDDETSKRT